MGAQSEVDETPQEPAAGPLIAPDLATMPWPDEELIYRVTGYTDRTTFYISGHQSVQDLEAVLGVVGRSLDTFPTILDFGSGCGRILLWLEHLAKVSSIHGSDIDARAIAWTQENVPWAETKVNQPLPPLDYPDATFDLVFSHSVFTHIDEHYQDEWLTELRRVVKPGGYAILSVHGETAFTRFEEAVAARGGDPNVIRRELSRGASPSSRTTPSPAGPSPTSTTPPSTPPGTSSSTGPAGSRCAPSCPSGRWPTRTSCCSNGPRRMRRTTFPARRRWWCRSNAER